jgi:hypothetical protein
VSPKLASIALEPEAWVAQAFTKRRAMAVPTDAIAALLTSVERFSAVAAVVMISSPYGGSYQFREKFARASASRGI